MRLANLLTLATLCLSAEAAAAQSGARTSLGALVGTWRVVEFCDIDATGRRSESLGPHPVGFLIYDRAGSMSVQMMRTPLPDQLRDSVPIGAISALRPYFFAYFGTYTVLSDTTLVHHVQGGTIPDYIGTDQPRAYRIRGDTLSIGSAPLPYCRILLRVP